MLAVLTILYGQGMGIVFGLNEDAIKNRLKASATEVRDTVYKGNDAAIKPVLDKSWVYMQRAHLHAGAQAGGEGFGGEVEISIAGQSHRLQSGQMILMPAQQPHALKAMNRFKMMLTMIRS